MDTKPVLPDFLNGPVLMGTVLAVLTIVLLFALIQMAPSARKQKTSVLAGGLFNMALIVVFALLLLGGGLILLASGVLDQYTTVAK